MSSIDKYAVEELLNKIDRVSDITVRGILSDMMDLILENDINIGECDSSYEGVKTGGMKFITGSKPPSV